MSNYITKYDPKAIVGSQRTLKDLLSSAAIKAAFAEVLPKHITAERISKMALVAAMRQPRLLECTQESIIKALMTASELGLDCSGTLGRGYLVPYKRGTKYEATFIIGYLGLIELARRSGEIESISADVVYRHDKLIIEKGIVEKFVHIPDISREKKDKDIIGAYMIARFRPKGHHIEYLSRQDIERIRVRSPAGETGPWATDFPAMAKKTAVRAGLKFCPLSIEIAAQIAANDTAIEGDVVPQIITPDDILPDTCGRKKWGEIFSETREIEENVEGQQKEGENNGEEN